MIFALRNCQQFPLAEELEIERSLTAFEQLFIMELVGSHGLRGMVLFFLHFDL